MKCREADKYLLRLPDGLRDTIKVIAAGNRRSMNSEIVLQLEKAFGQAAHETAQTSEGR